MITSSVLAITGDVGLVTCCPILCGLSFRRFFIGSPVAGLVLSVVSMARKA